MVGLTRGRIEIGKMTVLTAPGVFGGWSGFLGVSCPRCWACSVFFVFRLQAPFKPSDILLRWQVFGANPPIQQGVAHCLVVGDVFIENLPFMVHLMVVGVEDGDFRGKVSGLEQNCGRKVGQWSAFGHFPRAFMARVLLPNKAWSPLLRMSGKSWLPPVCSSMTCESSFLSR